MPDFFEALAAFETKLSRFANAVDVLENAAAVLGTADDGFKRSVAALRSNCTSIREDVDRLKNLLHLDVSYAHSEEGHMEFMSGGRIAWCA